MKLNEICARKMLHFYFCKPALEDSGIAEKILLIVSFLEELSHQKSVGIRNNHCNSSERHPFPFSSSLCLSQRTRILQHR
jgi:hypothetical protein